MAGIPLFSPEYLSSPTAEGVVSHKTADMMAEQGNLLSREIEVRSTKAEAQAKAPVLAMGYADAYTRIASGDFGGFEQLEKARAASVGNPFLMAMSEDASKEAGRLASSFMESQQLNARLAAQTTSQEAIANRQITAQESMMDRQNAQADAIAQRQREDDWRAQVANIQKENERREQEYQKGQAAKQRLAERQGTAYTPDPKPDMIPLPPQPLVNEKDLPANPAGSAGANPRPNPRQIEADSSNPLLDVEVGDNPLPATGLPPRVVSSSAPQGQGFTPVGAGMTELPAETKPVSMQVSGKAEPTVVLKAPEISAEKAEMPFGKMAVAVRVPKDTLKIDETIKTSTGSVTIKAKENANDEAKDAAKFLSSLADVQARDPVFAEWATKQLGVGHKVSIKKQKGDDKVERYQAYSVDQKGNEVPFGNKPDPVTKAGSPRLIDKETGESWLTAKKLMETTLKGKVQLSPNYTEEEKTLAQQKALKRIEKGMSVEEANKALKPYGAEFSPAQIKEMEKKKRLDKGRKQFMAENFGGSGGSDPLIGLANAAR